LGEVRTQEQPNEVGENVTSCPAYNAAADLILAPSQHVSMTPCVTFCCLENERHLGESTVI